MKKIFSVIVIVILLAIAVSAVKNPSAVYCEEMGYEFIINQTELGEVGICVLPDGTEVGAWHFLKGVVAQEFSYCNKSGLEIKTIQDSEKCSSISSYDCAVCVKDGEEVEITTLMNLDFKESVCGDNRCIILEENYGNCPQDCPSGAEDYLCDGIDDGICDPDCDKGGDDDCLDFDEQGIVPLESEEEIFQTSSGQSNWLLYLGIVLFLGIIAFGIVMFRKLKPKKVVKKKNVSSKPKPTIKKNIPLKPRKGFRKFRKRL